MNRWFDKTCQFVVNRNGINGICYEHSGAEAPPVIALCNMVSPSNSSSSDRMFCVMYDGSEGS